MADLPDVDIPACADDIFAPFVLDAIASPAPDSDAYVEPQVTSTDAFAAAVRAALEERWLDAEVAAQASGYTLCGNADLVRLVPAGTQSGHARLLLRRDVTASDWVFGAPHVYFDTATLAESLVLFEEARGRALIVSGVHRCTNLSASGCDGRTSVCGVTDEEFRSSDMAHTEASFFQVAHSTLAAAWPDADFVSVHGMGDSGASLSDGTDDATQANALVAQLATALRTQFPGELITTCNDYAGAEVRVLKCGTTNTQGRAINGSPDACDLNPDAAGGHFVHLEQSSDLRAAPEKVAAAFASLNPSP